ncbi:MAG TPA: isoprenylcysteine carboxylmethyltransferase family protein [Thermoanaerobaculia bacterium]|nr:isoprenylcysteine carboxylmethyltransferase family protein [Thermoanaerobaculia bacterium]
MPTGAGPSRGSGHGLPRLPGSLAHRIRRAWTHRKRNVTRADHELVTWGPYRYERHPMYPTFLLLSAGMFLLTAHWVIGLPPFLGVALVMAFRTPREEAMMIERFGEEYRSYANSVGRYLPRP